MDADRYGLDELADRVDVEKRTIRSYVQQGLLRGPEAMGRNAYYTLDHLVRLKAIRFLRQFEGMSLDDIRPRLLAMGDEQVADLAARFDAAKAAGTGMVTASNSATSALDYIESLKKRLGPGSPDGSDPSTAGRRARTRRAPPAAPPPASAHADWAAGDAHAQVEPDNGLAGVAFDGIAAEFAASPRAAGETPIDRVLSALEAFNGHRSVPARARGEGWVVIRITPDLELHVRGVNRADQLARLERIADHLREVLAGGTHHG